MQKHAGICGRFEQYWSGHVPVILQACQINLLEIPDSQPLKVSCPIGEIQGNTPSIRRRWLALYQMPPNQTIDELRGGRRRQSLVFSQRLDLGTRS
jgi:hypothetical protein